MLTLDKPELPAKQNIAIIRSDDQKSWLRVADHRGKTVYCTETRQASKIDFIGELPPTLTLLEPETGYDVWNGEKWVTDTEAQKAALISEAEKQKQLLLSEANNAISLLLDSVDLDMANDREIAQLKRWKIYRVLLNRVDTLSAQNIQWPQKP